MTAAAILSGLTAFFTAIPTLYKAAVSIGTWLNKISGNDPAAFVAKLGVAFDQLNSAETLADKQAATKSLTDLVSKLPD
jgi:hypothetical protein